MTYALPLRQESDRLLIGHELLVIRIESERVCARIQNRERYIAHMIGYHIVMQGYWHDRIAWLVQQAVRRLRDPRFAEAAAQMYAQRYARCARCRRRLTSPQSVRAGLGPECQKKN